MIFETLTDEQRLEAMRRLYVFASKTIIPTERGERQANAKYERELAAEMKAKGAGK